MATAVIKAQCLAAPVMCPDSLLRLWRFINLLVSYLIQNVTYRGDWYLLRAKFSSDSNILVLEIGRGGGVQDRSLEMTEVLWAWKKEGDRDRNTVCKYFGKGSQMFISSQCRLSFNTLVSNK